MLTHVELKHFKCFEKLVLPLNALTLLSGVNASGKSTVLQALVLLHQTMREHEWSSRLMLNGATIRFGTVSEVIDQVRGRRECGISLLDADDTLFRWEFEGERNEMSMAVSLAHVETGCGQSWDSDSYRQLQYLLPVDRCEHSLPMRVTGLTYLTAERLGPREHYSFDDPQLTPVVGPRGEYAISVLHSGRDKRVLDELVLAGVPPTRFHQVERRMRDFFPGCVIDIAPVARANSVTLGIRTTEATDYHRPAHIGFGLTQVLPIVVAALSTNKDDLLLIENPEVHLHPAGQTKMGEFLAEIAAAGVQVLVETHSDHVLSGIRKSVKNRVLSSDGVGLNFFRPRHEDEAQVVRPAIDSSGRIDHWPDGFFDQFDKDTNFFAGWN